MATPKFKMSNGMKSFVTKARAAVEAEAPAKKDCPKCERKREIGFFGVRTHRDVKTGKPNRFSLQSYCVDCRAGKVEKSKPAKRGKAARAPKLMAPKVTPQAEALPGMTPLGMPEAPKAEIVTEPAKIAPEGITKPEAVTVIVAAATAKPKGKRKLAVVDVVAPA